MKLVSFSSRLSFLEGTRPIAVLLQGLRRRCSTTEGRPVLMQSLWSANGMGVVAHEESRDPAAACGFASGLSMPAHTLACFRPSKRKPKGGWVIPGRGKTTPALPAAPSAGPKPWLNAGLFATHWPGFFGMKGQESWLLYKSTEEKIRRIVCHFATRTRPLRSTRLPALFAWRIVFGCF